VERNRSGKGAHLDLSQRELTTFLIGDAFLGIGAGAVPPASGDGGEIEGIFAAADGRYLAVTVPAEMAARVGEWLEGEGAVSLEAWIGSRPAEEAATVLRQMNVAAEPVRTAAGPNGDVLDIRNAFGRDETGRS